MDQANPFKERHSQGDIILLWIRTAGMGDNSKWLCQESDHAKQKRQQNQVGQVSMRLGRQKGSEQGLEALVELVALFRQ